MPFKFNPLTGNIEIVNGAALSALTPTKGNLVVGNGSTWTVIGVGSNGQLLQADSAQSTGVNWASVAGTGDVTAAANMTNNTIIRGDGGAKGVQDSGISVDDSDNVSGIGTLGTTGAATIDGSADAVQLTVQGHSTQTSNIVEIENSAATVLFSIDNSGNVGVNGTVDGRDLATDGTKLDGIEALADVTDATNVAAAGAVMDGDFSTNGVMIRTGAGTYTNRDITGTSNRISVANGSGVSGAPTIDIDSAYVGQGTITTIGTITTGTWQATDVGVAHGGTGASTAADARTNLGLAIGTDVQAYDADLAALSALVGNGMLARTGAATYAERTITGTSNEISVTNGNGVSGNPTLSLPATIDLGGKTSLEIPNSATPTVDADGEIAVDTTVTDFSHGILKYYGGEELGVVAMPIAEFTTPTDGHVVAYNATNDEFELVAQSGGTTPVDNVRFPARQCDASYTPIAPLEQDTTTNVIKKARSFDYATIEYCNSEYYVPPDIDTSGTVTFYVMWQARTAPSSDENVVWQVEHAAVADAEDLDSATFTAEVATAAATSTVQNQLNYTTWTETVSNLGWAADDIVFLKWSRKSTDANDTFDTRATTADDALAFMFGMEVPRA